MGVLPKPAAGRSKPQTVLRFLAQGLKRPPLDCRWKAILTQMCDPPRGGDSFAMHYDYETWMNTASFLSNSSVVPKTHTQKSTFGCASSSYRLARDYEPTRFDQTSLAAMRQKHIRPRKFGSFCVDAPAGFAFWEASKDRSASRHFQRNGFAKPLILHHRRGQRIENLADRTERHPPLTVGK